MGGPNIAGVKRPTRRAPLSAPVPSHRLKRLSGIVPKGSQTLVAGLVIKLSPWASGEAQRGTAVRVAAVVTTTEARKGARTRTAQPVTIDAGGLLDWYLRSQLKSELGRPEPRTIVLHDVDWLRARQCERFEHVAASADLHTIA